MKDETIKASGAMAALKGLLATVAGRRKVRKAAIARSFTRFYAHKPMVILSKTTGEPIDTRQLYARGAWEDGMLSWREGWKNARKEANPVDLGRRGQKAARLIQWRRVRAVRVAIKRDKRRAENIAKLAAEFNATFGVPLPSDAAMREYWQERQLRAKAGTP